MTSFDEACRFLFTRTAGGIKWGLETTAGLLAALGHPERHFACVHVGGTNGKGSTAAFLTAILRAQGFRVGLYTSPHLVSFTERMVVDGQPIPEHAVAAWVDRLRQPSEMLAATFFEITTAIALADFAARGVDIAVIEVGLGGRLDATNVLTPLACGVTRIALEHTEYLGSELAGIAREKAGIAKPDVPFLTTEQDDELVAAMAAEVAQRGSHLERVRPEAAAGYPLGLAGPHQLANASLAVALARKLLGRFAVSEDAVRQGLVTARIPGRFDRRGRWLFDVAHNPDGVRALVAALAAVPVRRPLAAVVAVLRDKAWREMLAILAPAVDRLIVTRAPSAPEERAWNLEEVRGEGEGEGEGKGEGEGSGPRSAVEAVEDLGEALRRAAEGAGTVLVTGSFHTVGDAMRLLGIDPAA